MPNTLLADGTHWWAKLKDRSLPSQSIQESKKDRFELKNHINQHKIMTFLSCVRERSMVTEDYVIEDMI